MPEWLSTLDFRWDQRMVHIPSSFQGGGPGTQEMRVFLQQMWREVGEPKKATQKDVNAGNAAFVGSSVVMIGQWRDVPGLDIGLKP